MSVSQIFGSELHALALQNETELVSLAPWHENDSGRAVMPTNRRLQCPFPLCPVSCKSPNGLTRHIRAMHTNSNARRMNREPANPEAPDEAQAESKCGGGGPSHSNDLANRQHPVAQRIEHPHLTGMGSLLS